MKAVSGKDFCRALEKRGWRLLRIQGSHHIYADSSGDLRVSVPVHANEDLKIGLLRRLMKDTGVAEEDL